MVVVHTKTVRLTNPSTGGGEGGFHGERQTTIYGLKKNTGSGTDIDERGGQCTDSVIAKYLIRR